jgi:hypothetical protein
MDLSDYISIFSIVGSIIGFFTLVELLERRRKEDCENSPNCPNCDADWYNVNKFESNCDECGYRETNK